MGNKDKMLQSPRTTLDIAVPEWVPAPAITYLAHTETGVSIRALARDLGCHASTVLRQIRRMEMRRDDPLIDSALRTLGRSHFQPDALPTHFSEKEAKEMEAARFKRGDEYMVVNNPGSWRVLLVSSSIDVDLVLFSSRYSGPSLCLFSRFSPIDVL